MKRKYDKSKCKIVSYIRNFIDSRAEMLVILFSLISSK